MRTGNAALLNTGAVASRPRIRVSGNTNRASQVSSWAELIEIILWRGET
jgi:hypothetical protein